jgi:PIN domain nuclease of toxin-antitoxin system
MRLHERKELSSELTHQKEEWQKRQLVNGGHTVAVGPLHAATETAASKHHHDNVDADHTPEGEHIAHMRTHERKELSSELAHQKEEWLKRQLVNGGHTVAVGPSHAATETAASKHHHDAADADHTPEGESIAHRNAHEREEASADNAKQRAAWEKRVTAKSSTRDGGSASKPGSFKALTSTAGTSI